MDNYFYESIAIAILLLTFGIVLITMNFYREIKKKYKDKNKIFFKISDNSISQDANLTVSLKNKLSEDKYPIKSFENNEKIVPYIRKMKNMNHIVSSLILYPEFIKIIDSYTDKHKFNYYLKNYYEKIKIMNPYSTDISFNIPNLNPFLPEFDSFLFLYYITRVIDNNEGSNYSSLGAVKTQLISEIHKLFLLSFENEQLYDIQALTGMYDRKYFKKVINKCRLTICKKNSDNNDKITEIYDMSISKPPEIFTIFILPEPNLNEKVENMGMNEISNIKIHGHFDYKLRSFHLYKKHDDTVALMSFYKDGNDVWKCMFSNEMIDNEMLEFIINKRDFYLHGFYERS